MCITATFDCSLVTGGRHSGLRPMFDLAEFLRRMPFLAQPRRDLCLQLETNPRPFACPANLKSVMVAQ